MIDFEDIFNSFEKKVVDQNKVKNIIDNCRNLIIEKFGDINFIEESHQYFIDEREYTPVSTIIDRYAPEVDWDKKAEDFARKHGRTKEDVQKEWSIKNLKSTISGTRTHEFGESYTNVLCGHPELICEQNKPQYVEKYNMLLPTYPKEEAIVNFYTELEPNLHPVGAEFRLSSKYINNSIPVCGTCDLLFYDSDRDGYVLADFKTNKSLTKDYARKFGIKMIDCMSDYIDEPLSHYIMQLSIYQEFIESIGLKILDRMIVWLKDDGTYEKIYCNRLDKDIIEKILDK